VTRAPSRPARESGPSFVVTCAHCGHEADVQGLTLSLLSAMRASLTAVPHTAGAPPSVLPVLRPREREVLALVAEGWTVARIAEQFGIREGTVRKHLESVYRAVGVRSKAELVDWLRETSGQDES
jgi:DNA-binding NarL/FixJ family response regulator